MRARRAGTAEGGSLPGAGPAPLATAVSLPTARAARLGASAPNTPETRSSKPFVRAGRRNSTGFREKTRLAEPRKASRMDVFASRRMAAILLLGFGSGLPFYL